MIYHSFYSLIAAEWCKMYNERKPQRLREFHEDIPEGMQEEWCPVCQLTLSSKIVAISHYKGWHNSLHRNS